MDSAKNIAKGIIDGFKQPIEPGVSQQFLIDVSPVPAEMQPEVTNYIEDTISQSGVERAGSVDYVD